MPLLEPFLLLDNFGSANPDDYSADFSWHPHRGIETVTYLLAGAVEHGDSPGNCGVIYSGDVQWMTAGNGIIHQVLLRCFDGHRVAFSAGEGVKSQTGTEPVRFLFISGQPLNEPIAWRGPIVMNTQEELSLALQEFRNGTFINLNYSQIH